MSSLKNENKNHLFGNHGLFDYYKKMVPTDQVTSAFILNKNVIHE